MTKFVSAMGGYFWKNWRTDNCTSIVGSLNDYTQFFYLIAFLERVSPVRVWKMNVAACFLHNSLDIVTTFSYYVWMVSVRNVHFQGHPVALKEKRQFINNGTFPLCTHNEEKFRSLCHIRHQTNFFLMSPILTGRVDHKSTVLCLGLQFLSWPHSTLACNLTLMLLHFLLANHIASFGQIFFLPVLSVCITDSLFLAKDLQHMISNPWWEDARAFRLWSQGCDIS